mgnify:CR=1 FL=1
MVILQIEKKEGSQGVLIVSVSNNRYGKPEYNPKCCDKTCSPGGSILWQHIFNRPHKEHLYGCWMHNRLISHVLGLHHSQFIIFIPDKAYLPHECKKNASYSFIIIIIITLPLFEIFCIALQIGVTCTAHLQNILSWTVE